MGLKRQVFHQTAEVLMCVKDLWRTLLELVFQAF